MAGELERIGYSFLCLDIVKLAERIVRITVFHVAWGVYYLADAAEPVVQVEVSVRIMAAIMCVIYIVKTIHNFSIHWS